jgi:hypothetical protein
MLVERIVNAPDLSSAAAATREALARAGVATVDSGGIRTPVTEPAASATATPLETGNLAIEARSRPTTGRMTASRLGQMLQDFGWPIAAGASAGDQVVDFLGLWVTEARAAPEDPRNFAPLFLAAMAERQVPAIDLATGAADPNAIHFTLLDLQVLAAAFDRATKLDTAVTGRRTLLAATDPGPCTQFKKRLGTFGEIGSVVADESLSKALEKTLEAMHGEDAVAVQHLFDAVAIAGRIWKLIAFYLSGKVSVTLLSDDPQHKQAPSEAHQQAGFEARAGVSAEDYRRYQEEIGAASADDRAGMIDCFDVLGIANWGEPTRLAREVENWRVEWRIINPDGTTHDSKEHVSLVRGNNDSLFSNGHLRQRMVRDDTTSAHAILVATLTDEKRNGHLGRIESATLTTRAELITSGVPDLSTLATAATGALGIIESLVELAAGWIQEALPPKAYAEFTVEYHVDDGRRYQLLMTNTWDESFPGPTGTVRQTGIEAHAQVTLAFRPGSEHGYVGYTEFSATYTNDQTFGEQRCHDTWGGTVPVRASFVAAPGADGKDQLASLEVLPTGPSKVFGAMVCGKLPPPPHVEVRFPHPQGLELPLPGEGKKVVELPPTRFNRWKIEIEAQ